jgi:hypothetical protein
MMWLVIGLYKFINEGRAVFKKKPRLYFFETLEAIHCCGRVR